MKFGKLLGEPRRKTALFAAAASHLHRMRSRCGSCYRCAFSHSGPWAPASIKVASHSGTEDARGYSRVVKEVVPAVVNISSSRVSRQETGRMQGLAADGPVFPPVSLAIRVPGQFNVPKERREKSLGSGVIVSPEGYVLTNNFHVVDHATEITVTLRDKREMKAELVGTDPRTDIAVLKIEGSNFPYVTLGDSSKVQVGDIALAIGNPFGVGQTVTMGISCSAMGRSNLGIEEVEDFIQTRRTDQPGQFGWRAD